jgi:hypothetical protein
MFDCACAAPDTPIATPTGERSIAELAEGDLVYTVDQGAIVVLPIVFARRHPAPPGHEVLRVELDDGRAFEMSAGHPTADGRMLGDLARSTHTFDIRPAGTTGSYFAAGALVGSTLDARGACTASAD